MTRVLLFDLDGTLMDAGQAGRRAFRSSLEMIRPDLVPRMDRTSFAGRTDLGLMIDLIGVDEAPLLLHQMDAIYPPLLWASLSAEVTPRILPGVLELLKILSHEPDLLLMVQTGNMRWGANLKLRFFGMEHWFVEIVSGDQASSRVDLLQKGLEKARELAKDQIQSKDCFVIGDTKEEAIAAHALGMISIGVETGITHSRVAEGFPDFLMSDLTDPTSFLHSIQ